MLKKPLEYNEQVKKLIEHGMIVDDTVRAEDIIRKVNYYRITGYALQFRKAPNDSDYKVGTTFEHVYKIYQFDEDLRDILRTYIESVEVYFRTVISHEFAMAKCTKEPFDQHYDKNNYHNKNGFEDIKYHFQKEKSYYKDSLIMKHHDKKYKGKMPLWVMVEMMSLSDVSKLYSCMYYSEQDRISDVVGCGTKTLKNHLHCVSVLRNKCAHAARLYNTKFYPSAELSRSFLRSYPEVINDTLFSYLVVLIKRLSRKEQRLNLLSDIEKLIEEFEEWIELSEMGFPQDWETIMVRQTV